MEDFQLPSFNLPMLFITFFFMLMVFKVWKKSKTNLSTPNLPPGPYDLPIIGSMHQLIGPLTHRRLADLAKKYGPVMRVQVGELTIIVISSAEAAKQVMKTHDAIFAPRSDWATQILFYNCQDIAFAPDGPYWRLLRKMCAKELLSAKRVQSFRSIREEEVSTIITSISSSSSSSSTVPINISNIISALTFRVVSRAAIGNIWKREEEFLVTMEKLLAEVGQGLSIADIFPSIKLLSYCMSGRRRLMKYFKQVDKIFQSIISDCRSRTGENSTSVKREEVLIDVLLNFQEKGNLQIPLTDVRIKAVLMDVFIAGVDTTATTIEWMMSEMIRNPRVMEKAQAEVRRIFDAKGNVDEGGLDQLHYLKLVINETLRLHPPGPFLIPRECKEDCVINDYDIPAKAIVMVNAWALGRDPKYWIEPENFYPERFIDNPINYKGNHFEYIPFGAGRKICAGLQFGIANIELPVAQLLYHFDWKLPHGLNPENLDMTEYLGNTLRRKSALCLIPTPYVPPVLK